MKKLLLLIFLWVSACTGLFAQITVPNRLVWEKTFSADRRNNQTCVIRTADGGFLLGGHSNSNGSGDKSQSSCIYPGNHSFSGSPSPDYWIIKTDIEGNKQWERTYGGSTFDHFYHMVQTPDKGYLLVGSSSSYKSCEKSFHSFIRPLYGWHPSLDFWAVKIDSLGNKLWDNVYGSPDNDFPAKVILCEDGNYLICGTSEIQESLTDHPSTDTVGNRTAAYYGEKDFWVVKIDPNGNKLWDKSYGGTQDDVLTAAVSLGKEGFMLGGISHSKKGGTKTQEAIYGEFDRSDYWVVKIDTAGNQIKDFVWGRKWDDFLIDMTLLNDSTIVLGGESGLGTWLIKIDRNGKEIWQRNYDNTMRFQGFGQTDGRSILFMYKSETRFVHQPAPYANWIVAAEADLNGKLIWNAPLHEGGSTTYDEITYEFPNRLRPLNQMICKLEDNQYIVSNHQVKTPQSQALYDTYPNSLGRFYHLFKYQIQTDRTVNPNHFYTLSAASDNQTAVFHFTLPDFEPVQVRIYNLMGQPLLTFRNQNDWGGLQTVVIQSLPVGVYVAHFVRPSGEIVVRKFHISEP